MNRAVYLVFTSILGLLLCTEAKAVQYTVTDLGTLGGGESAAYAINSSGQVVGWAHDASDNQRAFLYTGGVMSDLGDLGADVTAQTLAWDINDSGQISGTAETASDFHAFRYENSVMTDLGTLGGPRSQGPGINADGDVVGVAETSPDPGPNLMKAALWEYGGTIISLGTLPTEGEGESFAYDINDLGVIVGESTSGDWGSGPGYLRAFKYESGSMTSLGALASDANSCAHAVNNTGQVVGYSYTDDDEAHAFLYEDATMSDLGTLGGIDSNANDINSDGLIVGYSSTEGGAQHAFLYQNGTMLDLNDLLVSGSDWVLNDALGINDQGQIVGYGTRNGNTRAFVLTIVPEPASLLLLLSGGCLLLRRRRHRCA